MGRIAFTLIEVIVCLSILALVASGSMLMLSGQLRSAAKTSALTEFALLERTIRDRSYTQAVTLDIALQEQQISAARVPNLAMQLPPHVRLKTVVLGGAVLDNGVVRIPLTKGRSPTYALHFQPDKGLAQWLVVCGPTGQINAYPENEVSQQQLVSWMASWSNTN